MKLLYCYFLTSFVLFPVIGLSQIAITYPSDRVVFQRDNANLATIYVAGFFNEDVIRVEARFVPLIAGEGKRAPENGGWTVIQNSPTGNNYYGSMPVAGGWYRLEVQGIRNKLSPVTATVEHVGVGEVFVVAGQSNGSGNGTDNGPGATSDQVSTIDFQNYQPLNSPQVKSYPELKLPCPQYVHLDAGTKPAPFGIYAWCWGAFGDQLSEREHVPVMIFNASWSATGIKNWKESTDGNFQTQGLFLFEKGMPFGHLRITLNNYLAQSGIRAVLWQHGETDCQDNISRNEYRSGLRDVINASRQLSGKDNLAWVVARATRFTVDGASKTWPDIIAAQNDLAGTITPGFEYSDINKLPNVFKGPSTDEFYGPDYRRDGDHFSGTGLLKLAQLWADELTPEFLSSSTPYPAIPPPNVSATRSGTTDLTFSSPFAPSSVYNWLNQNDCNEVQSSSQNLTRGPGDYRLKVTDSHNNSVLSAVLHVPAVFPLPVTLQYFTVKELNSGLGALQWATAEEVNSASFEVERSSDAIHFNKLASIPARGNSKSQAYYTYQDQLPEPGKYYYRLKQVDLNGNFVYSRIISLQLSNYAKKTIRLYPNPVADQLTIESEAEINLVQIINSAGQQIFSSPYKTNLLKLDVKGFPSGLYNILVDGKSFSVLH